VIITIDGPAGSGKSTISKLLAERLHCEYLDTGAMYRAVALQAKREEIDPARTEKLRDLCHHLDLRFKTEGKEKRVFIGDEDVSSAIRTPEIDLLSSSVSSIKEVREAMTALQRKVARNENLIAEGRDMGTVVFPDAPFKFFITASSDVRAERRYRERTNRGEKVLRHQVKSDLATRDEQDRTRSIAPSIPAKDAMIIDTSSITPEQVVGIILEKIKDRGGEAS
jgi:cytidylate kinase